MYNSSDDTFGQNKTFDVTRPDSKLTFNKPVPGEPSAGNYSLTPTEDEENDLIPRQKVLDEIQEYRALTPSSMRMAHRILNQLEILIKTL